LFSPNNSNFSNQKLIVAAVLHLDIMRVDSLLPVQAMLALIVLEEALLFVISKTKAPQVIIVLVVVMRGEVAPPIKLDLAVTAALKLVLMDLGVIAVEKRQLVFPQLLLVVELVSILLTTTVIAGHADIAVAVQVVITEVVRVVEEIEVVQPLIHSNVMVTFMKYVEIQPLDLSGARTRTVH